VWLGGGIQARCVQQALRKNVASNKGQMPSKKPANSETNALVPSKAALAEIIPPINDALTNAVLERVIQRVNLDGLRDKVLDEAAARLAQSVHVDTLIQHIVGQSEQHLADRLSERVLEHIALGKSQEDRTEDS